MFLVEIILAAILAKCTSAVESSSSDSQLLGNGESNATMYEDWSCDTVPTRCLILTTYNYRVPGKNSSVYFNCNVPPYMNAHSDRVFRHVVNYHMDGTAACGDTGFGLEYLSFRDNIKLLVLEGYRLQTMRNDTFQSFGKLEQLEIIACNVHHALKGGFRLLPALRKLVIANSAFVTMDPEVLIDLVQLEQLIIEQCTGIDFNASVLANIELIEVTNSAVQSISSIFEPLPVTLRDINFVNVSSQQRTKLRLESANESVAQHITLVQCLLHSLAVKNIPQLVALNLSKNALTESSLELTNLPALATLVLSHNEFVAVSQTLLNFGSGLDTIDLSHNRISSLHPQAFDVAYALRTVNLSHNLLFSIETFQPHPRLDRIEIDSNPWDCLWLNRIRLLNPTLFNVFRYDKRYDVLSVWGLPCFLQPKATDANSPSTDRSTAPDRYRSHPQGKIFLPPDKKLALAQQQLTIANPLKVITSIAFGVLITNVVILLYNRYRNILREPFYRHLSKLNGDAMTEKSSSFWYEVPICGQTNDIPLNHIYEEIRDAGPHRDVYDALNFQRGGKLQTDDNTSS